MRPETSHQGMMLSRRWMLKLTSFFVGGSCILMDTEVSSVWLQPFHFTATNGVNRMDFSRVNYVRYHDDVSSLPLLLSTSNMFMGRWSSACVPTQLFPGTDAPRHSSPSCMPTAAPDLL